MAAGLTGLTEIWVEPALSELNARGDDLRHRANALLRAAGLPPATAAATRPNRRRRSTQRT